MQLLWINEMLFYIVCILLLFLLKPSLAVKLIIETVATRKRIAGLCVAGWRAGSKFRKMSHVVIVRITLVSNVIQTCYKYREPFRHIWGVFSLEMWCCTTQFQSREKMKSKKMEKKKCENLGATCHQPTCACWWFSVTAIKANQLNLETVRCLMLLLLKCVRFRCVIYLVG